jgi:hypothetical protein
VFCPECRDEFRLGFTRCGRCNVDLVDELTERPAPTPDEAEPAQHVPMAEYCGFVSLDEARESRETLKAGGVRCDILIRESPDGRGEEYWLRVEAARYKDATGVLGFHTVDGTGADGFQCGECGHDVAAEESFCPKCGARFEDD